MITICDLPEKGLVICSNDFFLDWENTTLHEVHHEHEIYFPPLEAGKYEHKIVPSEGIFLEDTFSQMIREAQSTITIGTPYFIPGRKVFQDLQDALKRGVNIEILVPSVADHMLVKEASYRYFRILIPLGAQIFQYQKGFYHAKVLIIDDKVCDVGTANFDKRSFYLNLEINCLTYDKEFIEHVRGVIKTDQSHSKVMKLEDIQGLNPLIKGKEVVANAISLFL